MLDPTRDKPTPIACAGRYPSCDHDDWRHAKNWAEVEEYLDAGACVIDQDGDEIEAITHIEASLRPEEDRLGTVRLTEGGLYEYPAKAILLEDVDLTEPVTPEEEQAAIASILGSA